MDVRRMRVSVYSIVSRTVVRPSLYRVSYVRQLRLQLRSITHRRNEKYIIIQRDGGGLHELSRIFFFHLGFGFTNFFSPHGSCFPRRNAIVHT